MKANTNDRRCGAQSRVTQSPTQDDVERRVANLLSLLEAEAEAVGSAVFLDYASIRYLSGFSGGLLGVNGGLVVGAAGRTLFVDPSHFRFADQPALEAPGAAVVETQDPVDALVDQLEGDCAIDPERITVSMRQSLERGGRSKALPVMALATRLRQRKDAYEIERLRAAAAVSDEVFGHLLTGDSLIGRTEREIAVAIDAAIRALGGDGTSFETRVLSGENASRPHGMPAERVVSDEDLVLIDFGCVVNGYTADCTRMFVGDQVPAVQKEAVETALDALDAAISAIRPGAKCSDIDGEARRVIDESAFRGEFGHGLGHGIGLEVHELPVLTPEARGALEAGNTVTVEPGIYREQEFGVRIEEDVLVTDDGCEVLTHFPRVSPLT